MNRRPICENKSHSNDNNSNFASFSNADGGKLTAEIRNDEGNLHQGRFWRSVAFHNSEMRDGQIKNKTNELCSPSPDCFSRLFPDRFIVSTNFYLFIIAALRNETIIIIPNSYYWECECNLVRFDIKNQRRQQTKK